MAPLISAVRADRRIAGSAIAVGLLLILFYVGTVGLTSRWGRLPIRPLYDGLARPIPYYWVKLPEGAEDNFQFRVGPAGGQGTVAFSRLGSRPASVATDDAQAAVAFPAGAIAPRIGEDGVDVIITPLDADGLLPPQPGTRLNGNAYRVAIRYERTRAPAVLHRPVTVVLRYPNFATQILRLTDVGWIPLPTNISPDSLQVYAETESLGTFAAAAPPGSRPPITRGALTFVVLKVVLALTLVFVAGFFLQGWLRLRRGSRGDR